MRSDLNLNNVWPGTFRDGKRFSSFRIESLDSKPATAHLREPWKVHPHNSFPKETVHTKVSWADGWSYFTNKIVINN